MTGSKEEVTTAMEEEMEIAAKVGRNKEQEKPKSRKRKQPKETKVRDSSLL